MNAVFVTCKCCEGSGRIELTGPLAETLELLRKQPAEFNGTTLARIAKIRPTAMIERLKRLEAIGLARGRRHCRERLWRSIEEPSIEAHEGR